MIIVNIFTTLKRKTTVNAIFEMGYRMTNSPLTSNEHAKVMIFVLLLLPTLFFLIGIIPAIFLVFGVFMMRKNFDFSHIETATKNFRINIKLIIALNVLSALFAAVKLGDGEGYISGVGEMSFMLTFSLIAITVCLFYISISNKLFLEPLRRHKDWVEKNGIFSSKAKHFKSDLKSSEISIIRGEKLRSFSVADELLKWAKLKEDGNITEQEYNEARKKLLQGD